jgi:hypothetical protein
VVNNEGKHKVIRYGDFVRIYGLMDIYKRHFFVEISNKISDEKEKYKENVQ